VFIEVPRELRLQRIAQQRGWTEKEVGAREQAQLPLAEKARRANTIVTNAGSPDDLRRQIHALLERWGVRVPESSPES
jgi:dephospho-CoA kinase